MQTGEAKYGKSILDWAVNASATLQDATKCVLVSFDSTMLSNLSVGMPIDLLCDAKDSLRVTMQRWINGARQMFHDLPPLVCETAQRPHNSDAPQRFLARSP